MKAVGYFDKSGFLECEFTGSTGGGYYSKVMWRQIRPVADPTGRSIWSGYQDAPPAGTRVTFYATNPQFAEFVGTKPNIWAWWGDYTPPHNWHTPVVVLEATENSQISRGDGGEFRGFLPRSFDGVAWEYRIGRVIAWAKRNNWRVVRVMDKNEPSLFPESEVKEKIRNLENYRLIDFWNNYARFAGLENVLKLVKHADDTEESRAAVIPNGFQCVTWGFGKSLIVNTQWLNSK